MRFAIVIAGIPAAVLIGIILLLMRSRGSAAVWPLYVATALGLTAVLVYARGQHAEQLNVFLALCASLILLLPVPMMLDVDVEPGMRLGRRALIAFGIALGLALLLSAPIAYGLLGLEGP